MMIYQRFFFIVLFLVSAVSAHAAVDYYTCGMHPSVKVLPEQYEDGDTQCPICSMNLIPVEKEESSSEEAMDHSAHETQVVSRVRVAEEELERAGVTTMSVQKMTLAKEITVPGIVAFDPSLAVAQDEYREAVRSLQQIKQSGQEEFIQRAQALADAARKKLILLGLDESYIEHVGMGHVAGDLLLPSERMWVYGDLHEHEQAWVAAGQPVEVRAKGLAGRVFEGQIHSVNPTVDPTTRTIRFRVMVNNSDLLLKPNSYVDVTVRSYYMKDGQHETLAIPRAALLDTGRRRLVWVETAKGKFEGRQVVLGPLASLSDGDEAKEYYPVISGLREGEQVVTKGNFLIDSQSQITGTVSAAYGGALGGDKEEQKEAQSGMQGHVH